MVGVFTFIDKYCWIGSTVEAVGEDLGPASHSNCHSVIVILDPPLTILALLENIGVVVVSREEYHASERVKVSKGGLIGIVELFRSECLRN